MFKSYFYHVPMFVPNELLQTTKMPVVVETIYL